MGPMTLGWGGAGPIEPIRNRLGKLGGS